MTSSTPLPTMSERQKLLVFFAMSFGMFMAILDIQIVASSLSVIQAGLGATAEEVSRMQTSYLIAEVIMIPISGWLSQLFSTRWLFAGSAALFSLASAACAFAWNIESMMVFRAIQGFVGGAMIPTVFATGFTIFTGKKQNRVSIILGLVATMAPVAGPSLGGFITEYLNWRWLFWINVLPGILISLVVPRLLVLDKPNWNLAKHFDTFGFILLALFLGCLQYALDEGPQNSWLEDTTIRTLLIVSGVSGLVFIDRMLSKTNPLVDLRLFGNRNFALGCLLSFIMGVGLYCSVYFVPLYLGAIRGYSALQIGQTVFVVGVAQILTAPCINFLRGKIDARVLLSIAFSLAIFSCWSMSHITSTWGFNELFWPQVFRGMGFMTSIVIITGIAMGELPQDKLKNASGVYNLTRNLGGAIGLAFMNTQLFYNRLSLHTHRLGESMNEAALQSPAIHSKLQLGLLKASLAKQALTMSIADVFLLIAFSFGIGLLLIPFLHRVKLSADTGAHAE